jgi:hypothetical protein
MRHQRGGVDRQQQIGVRVDFIEADGSKEKMQSPAAEKAAYQFHADADPDLPIILAKR